MTYEKLRQGYEEEVRAVGDFRERTDPTRTREALSRREGESDPSYRRRLEAALGTESRRLERRRRLLELCNGEVMSRLEETDRRRHFFVLKETPEEKAAIGDEAKKQARTHAEGEFEALKGRCLGHRTWMRVHEDHVNSVSVALTRRRAIDTLTTKWVEPVSGEEATSLADVFQKQQRIAKVWHLQYARQYAARVILRPKRTPTDYFAEFRVWVWTREPDKYSEADLRDAINRLEEEFGGAWVEHTNVRFHDPQELQVRDEVDLDEAEDLDTVHYNVSFWRVKAGGREVIGEYWGTMRKTVAGWVFNRMQMSSSISAKTEREHL